MFFESQKLTAAIFAMLSLTVVGCAVTTTPEQDQKLEQAVESRDPTALQGTLRVLYDRRISEIEVSEAVAKRDPSSLKGRQHLSYARQVDVKLQEEASLQAAREAEEQKRLEALAAEAEKQRLEEERLAQLEREAAELAALQRAEAAENARLRKIADARAFQRKIKQPIHDNWISDMKDLTQHFRENGFEPATRLVDVYARTMQFLVHAKPNEQQFSAFYAKFSETEKLDHRRMFANKTGTELIAGFWDGRAGAPQ